MILSISRTKFIEDPEEIKVEKSKREEFFKSFLYEKKKIEKSEIWEMKQ